MSVHCMENLPWRNNQINLDRNDLYMHNTRPRPRWSVNAGPLRQMGLAYVERAEWGDPVGTLTFTATNKYYIIQ